MILVLEATWRLNSSQTKKGIQLEQAVDYDSPVEAFVSKLLNIVSRLISVERGHASNNSKQSPIYRSDFKLIFELVFTLTSRELSLT